MTQFIAFFAAAMMIAMQPAGNFSRIGTTSDPSEAVIGGFGTKMLVVEDIDAFWAAWDKPEPPQISTTSKITRGKPVHAVLVFNGCAPAPDGNCNLSVVYSITGPDGSAYDKPIEGKAWTGPPPPGFNMQAAVSSFGFELEPADKLGSYRMIAKVTDEVAGKTLTVSQIIEAQAN